MTMPMSNLPQGQRGSVIALKSAGDMRRRLLDLGLIPGTSVERVFDSPGGDPICFSIRGALIALRSHDAMQIVVNV
jgi:ferrous iron transport protein A